MQKVSENMTIEETLRIAIEAHEGQKDLDGRPVVLHPIAVGLMGCNDVETKTGFLHDQDRFPARCRGGFGSDLR